MAGSGGVRGARLDHETTIVRQSDSRDVNRTNEIGWTGSHGQTAVRS
jgi:hypothetical protein